MAKKNFWQFFLFCYTEKVGNSKHLISNVHTNRSRVSQRAEFWGDVLEAMPPRGREGEFEPLELRDAESDSSSSEEEISDE